MKTNLLWIVSFWLAMFVIMALHGCGAAEAPGEITHSEPVGVCYQEPDWVFSADICIGRVDVGFCAWMLPGGRRLHPTDCITQRGVTCVTECPR